MRLYQVVLGPLPKETAPQNAAYRKCQSERAGHQGAARRGGQKRKDHGPSMSVGLDRLITYMPQDPAADGRPNLISNRFSRDPGDGGHIAPLWTGHHSLMAEPTDLPLIAWHAGQRRHDEKRQDPICAGYGFGKCSFTFESEWNDRCLTSGSTEGDGILRSRHYKLNTGTCRTGALMNLRPGALQVCGHAGNSDRLQQPMWPLIAYGTTPLGYSIRLTSLSQRGGARAQMTNPVSSYWIGPVDELEGH